MTKDKEWLQKECQEMETIRIQTKVDGGTQTVSYLKKQDVLDLVEELKEDCSTREMKEGRVENYLKEEGLEVVGLPVIPSFVASWIEEQKKSMSISGAFSVLKEKSDKRYSEKVNNWLMEKAETSEFFWNTEVFARAWLDGYLVLEEPKHHVVDARGKTLLYKVTKGFGIGDREGEIVSSLEVGEKATHLLTEGEIISYDEKYLAFINNR